MNIRQHIAIFLITFLALSFWAGSTLYEEVYLNQIKSNNLILKAIPLSNSITHFKNKLEKYISPTYLQVSLYKDNKGVMEIALDMNTLIKKLMAYNIDEPILFKVLKVLTENLSHLKYKIKKIQVNKSELKNKIVMIHQQIQKYLNTKLEDEELLHDKNIIKKIGVQLDKTFLYKYLKNITQKFKYSNIDDIKLKTYQSLIMMIDSNHQSLNILQSSQLSYSFIENSSRIKIQQEAFSKHYSMYPKNDLQNLKENFLNASRKTYRYLDKTSKQKETISIFSKTVRKLQVLLDEKISTIIELKLNQIKVGAKNSTRNAFKVVLIIFILYIILILIFIISIEKRIINPLSKITSFTKNFSLDKTQLESSSFPRNETGTLFNSFVDMTTKLNLQFSQIQKHNIQNLELQTKVNQASKMATIGNLASGIAHEIKNPLAIIQLSLDDISSELTNTSFNKDILLEENEFLPAASYVYQKVSQEKR